VVKIGCTERVSVALFREADALETLHAERRLDDWVEFVPRLLATGTVDGMAYTAQQCIDGVDGCTALDLGLPVNEAFLAAVRAIEGLHRRTGGSEVLKEADVGGLVDGPLDLLLRVGGERHARRHVQRVAEMRTEMRAALAERPGAIGWIHGDYWLGNVLMGTGGRVAGIVDWGGMTRRGLVAVDLLHLVLTTRRLRNDRELGSLVAEAIEEPAWSPAEWEVLEPLAAEADADPAWWRAMVVLTWAHHVASNMRKSDRYGDNWVWVARNVDHVLAGFP
jgi:hypothetical protein